MFFLYKMSYIAAEGFVESYLHVARISPLMRGEYKAGGPDKLTVTGDVFATTLTGVVAPANITTGPVKTVLITPTTGPTQWGKMDPQYFAVGTANTSLVTDNSGVVSWGKVTRAIIEAGATNTVLTTGAGGVVAWSKVTTPMIQPGAANTVLLTDNTSTVKWGKLPISYIVPSPMNGQMLVTNTAGAMAWQSIPTFIGAIALKNESNVTLLGPGASVDVAGTTSGGYTIPNYNPATGVFTVTVPGLYATTIDVYWTNSTNIADSVAFSYTDAATNAMIASTLSYRVTVPSGEFVHIINATYMYYQAAGSSFKIRRGTQVSGVQSYNYRCGIYLIQSLLM